MGSVEPIGNGKVRVGEDFELLGWDFVSNPSTHGVFMTPVNESKQVISVDVCGNYCKIFPRFNKRNNNRIIMIRLDLE